eukprot:601854_1
MATSLQHTISVIALTLTITAMIHSTVSSYAIHHRLTPPSPLPHITNPLHSLVIISALFLEIICLIIITILDIICLIIITILDIICLIIITILETILPQHYPYYCQDIGDYPIIAVAAAAVTIMGINTFVPHSDHQITIPWLITLNLMDSNTFVPHSDHRITALWIITSYHIIIHFFAPSAKPFTHPYTFSNIECRHNQNINLLQHITLPQETAIEYDNNERHQRTTNDTQKHYILCLYRPQTSLYLLSVHCFSV